VPNCNGNGLLRDSQIFVRNNMGKCLVAGLALDSNIRIDPFLPVNIRFGIVKYAVLVKTHLDIIQGA